MSKISVCIPTYNRADLLKGAVRSVLNQTFGNFELLVLNDGSTDQTEMAVKKFNDDRIRYVENEENIGYVPSLNKCARLTRSEWVMFMSDDDLLLPAALERMVEVLEAVGRGQNTGGGRQILEDGGQRGNEQLALQSSVFENQSSVLGSPSSPIGMVVPQTILINADGDVISTPNRQLRGQDYLLLRPTEFIPNYTLYGKKIRGRYQFNTSFPSTLFRRELFLRFRDGSEGVPVAHDLLIGAKIALKHAVVIIDEPLIKYRVHENWGASLNRRGEFLSEYQRYLELLFEFVQEEKVELDYNFKEYCDDALVRYLFKIDGGLLRLAARFEGGYRRRLQKTTEYLKFGLRTRPVAKLSPTFYLTLGLSLLPQWVLLTGSDVLSSVFHSRPRTKKIQVL